MDFNARFCINSLLSERYLGRLVCHTRHEYSRTGLTTLMYTDLCTARQYMGIHAPVDFWRKTSQTTSPLLYRFLCQRFIFYTKSTIASLEQAFFRTGTISGVYSTQTVNTLIGLDRQGMLSELSSKPCDGFNLLYYSWHLGNLFIIRPTRRGRKL